MGCSPLIYIVVMVFVAGTLVASISPLLRLVARLVNCPTAQEVTYMNASGGIVTRPGPANDVATTITTMQCSYADGRTVEVENDRMFLTGMGGAVGLGVLSGLLLWGGAFV